MGRTKRTQIENMALANLKWSRDVRRMTEATLVTKRSAILGFIADSGVEDVKQIDHNTINRWLSRMMDPARQGKNPNTVITNRGYVLGWLRWAQEMGYPVRVKFPMVARPAPEPTQRKFYTREQIQKVLACTGDEMAHLIIRLGFDTGMRLSELSNIRLSDIDGKTIRVVGKGRKLAFVRMSDETHAELVRWIEQQYITDHLWVRQSRRGQEVVCSATVAKRVRLAFKAAGFDGFQMHELRHSFATDLRKRGASLDIVQRMMRHANLQVTERYLHNLESGLDEIWDKYRATNFSE